jgi:hypothetical protein
MIATGEDLLICDFAETYNIYDYRSLSTKSAAIYAAGLRADSRIMMKLSDSNYGVKEMLLSILCDEIRGWHYSMTEDAESQINKPQSIRELLFGTQENVKANVSFDSGEAFDEEWRRIINEYNS